MKREKALIYIFCLFVCAFDAYALPTKISFINVTPGTLSFTSDDEDFKIKKTKVDAQREIVTLLYQHDLPCCFKVKKIYAESEEDTQSLCIDLDEYHQVYIKYIKGGDKDNYSVFTGASEYTNDGKLLSRSYLVQTK